MRSGATLAAALTAFGSLLALTAATVGIAYVNLGPFNGVVALGIAGVKATVVALVFMRLARSERLTRIVAVTALAWVALLIVLVLLDTVTRVLPERVPIAPR